MISIAGHAPTVKLCALRIAPVCLYQCSLNKKSDTKICSTDFKANVPVNFEFVYTYSYLKYRNVHWHNSQSYTKQQKSFRDNVRRFFASSFFKNFTHLLATIFLVVSISKYVNKYLFHSHRTPGSAVFGARWALYVNPKTCMYWILALLELWPLHDLPGSDSLETTAYEWPTWSTHFYDQNKLSKST